MSDGGKGSNPRPYSVSQAEFSANWDRIFKKDSSPEPGTQRINPEGKLEQFVEGYWEEIVNRS